MVTLFLSQRWRCSPGPAPPRPAVGAFTLEKRYLKILRPRRTNPSTPEGGACPALTVSASGETVGATLPHPAPDERRRQVWECARAGTALALCGPSTVPVTRTTRPAEGAALRASLIVDKKLRLSNDIRISRSTAVTARREHVGPQSKHTYDIL
ncbi:hypothetical protein EVAR_85550_1 [Eumeta japonica]|uniref:Uncharacterized protein n=1 Tax=Eumeta variegata TaxID=151549 RepID=A0A4C1VBR9_EUMVA|nr:hypothetical protein EVAR_85550_1 [Eumeta japonica]